MNRRRIALVLTGLFLLSLMASCSDKGVHMPKHRKRRHCDCPTFALGVRASSPAFPGLQGFEYGGLDFLAADATAQDGAVAANQ